MTAEHTAMSPTRTPGSILGTRVTRTEDPGLLTGAAIYLDDLHIEGSLHAVFVRSDVAHGTIISIETAEAASMPGVIAVLTFADLGIAAHHGFAPVHDDFKRPPLADASHVDLTQACVVIVGDARCARHGRRARAARRAQRDAARSEERDLRLWRQRRLRLLGG